MSGSGGNGYSGGFEPATNCDTLYIETQLSSPKDDVIADINVGEQLEVALQQLEATTVVVVKHHGKIAGGVAAPQVNRLRECIAQGTEYEAIVIGKNDGQVRIRIQPVRRA